MTAHSSSTVPGHVTTETTFCTLITQRSTLFITAAVLCVAPSASAIHLLVPQLLFFFNHLSSNLNLVLDYLPRNLPSHSKTKKVRNHVQYLPLVPSKFHTHLQLPHAPHYLAVISHPREQVNDLVPAPSKHPTGLPTMFRRSDITPRMLPLTPPNSLPLALFLTSKTAPASNQPVCSL